MSGRMVRTPQDRAPIRLAQATIRDELRALVRFARASIPTEPAHAIRHHRADEAVRNLLEEVIHE